MDIAPKKKRGTKISEIIATYATADNTPEGKISITSLAPKLKKVKLTKITSFDDIEPKKKREKSTTKKEKSSEQKEKKSSQKKEKKERSSEKKERSSSKKREKSSGRAKRSSKGWNAKTYAAHKERLSYHMKQKELMDNLDEAFPEEAAESRKHAAKRKVVESDEAREIKSEEAISGLPYWILPEHRMDKNKKKVNEEGYDPTTLWIPHYEYLKLPSIHKKYWKVKSRYFDKMVAVKMWSFYYFYGMDAIIVHKAFDTKLNELKGKIYTQFSEARLTEYATKLLEAGHKIVIVEKMKKNQKKDDERTKKGVVQIMTRGTFADNPDIGYSSQFCLCVIEYQLKFGVMYFDTTTHEFYIGEFTDDMYRANLRTLITKIKPVEVVYIAQFLDKETLNMFKALPVNPTLSPIHLEKGGKIPTISEVFKKLMKYFNTRATTTKPALPKLLADIKAQLDGKFKETDEEGEQQSQPVRSQSQNPFNSQSQNSQRAAPKPTLGEANILFFFSLQATMLGLQYLENLLLAETIFVMGDFFAIDVELEKKSTLYLDSQALEHLEVLDIGYLSSINNGDYSLFGYMDKTVTAFGKRMFKRWITSPLYDADTINERLEAVDELRNNPEVIHYFSDMMKGFPDLERIVHKSYTGINKKKLIASQFEDFAKTRLGDFVALLGYLEKIEPLIEKLSKDLSDSNSRRLRQLTKIKDVDIKLFEQKQQNYRVHNSKGEGMFPKISHLINDLKAMIQNKDGVLLPAPGFNEECDNFIAQIDGLKEDFQEILAEQKQHFRCPVLKFVHTKHRYEIEIPEGVLENSTKPKEFTITSKKKGFLRYHIPDIEKCLKTLGELEEKLTRSLVVFVIDYFKKFYERKAYWNQVVLCLAELDCLCGLAKLTGEMRNACKPIVVDGGSKPVFDLKDMIHPCAALRNPNFVANDLVVENGASLFLLTGPNMGGKSTFLRQTCIAVIMAQVGSFVPASYFKFSPIDRIFTRLGASDRLIEGKSTFFIEMEETYHILKEGTKNSLLVVDELGRGTSTYDGVSIAYATLKFIAQKLKCVTVFATHYHLLIEEFQLYKNVVTYCMLCDFNEEKEELKFLYKFVKGTASSSHGLMIAKLSGLPNNVLKMARAKADMMTKEKMNVNLEAGLTGTFNSAIQSLTKVEDASDRKIELILAELALLK